MDALEEIMAEREKIIAEGLAKGKAEGEESKALEIARNLLAEGSTFEFVHKTTGLPLNEIEKLRDGVSEK